MSNMELCIQRTEIYRHENIDFMHNFVLISGDICIKDLDNIQARTLIIHGLKDPFVPLEHPDFLHRNIKGSR